MLTAAVSASRPPGESRLTHLRLESLQSLLLTLLFLPVVGLRRTWDLRSYTGDALASLSGRLRAYGYRHVERFLSQVALTAGVEVLTPVYNWLILVFGEGTGKDGSSLIEVSVRRGNQRCISPFSETDSPKTRMSQNYAGVDRGNGKGP
jgi:hypothetical protein